MKWDQKCLQMGAAAILGALVLRLLSALSPGSLLQTLSTPDSASLIFFAQTGRWLTQETTAQETQPQAEVLSPAPSPLRFSAEDAALVSFHSTAGYTLDTKALLEEPLNWELQDAAPKVLILHTHTCESYKKTEDYIEDTPYRTQDADYNMLSIGDALVQTLEQAGIGVIHDRTVHDYPSYNGSYAHARESIQTYLAQYPTVELVLDLHRDARESSSGEQLGPTVTVDGQAAAQLMLVLGSDKGGQTHPSWQKNLSLGVKLQAAAERLYPGLFRPISLRAQRFNQDLSPGALLIEVGAAGNTREEALNAVQALGHIIEYLAHGSVTTE